MVIKLGHGMLTLDSKGHHGHGSSGGETATQFRGAIRASH